MIFLVKFFSDFFSVCKGKSDDVRKFQQMTNAKLDERSWTKPIKGSGIYAVV